MIDRALIDEILRRINIVDLIDEDLPLKKKGKDYFAPCPFHNEKTASFSVSEHKQFYHCFGCPAHGDALRWLMEHHGMSFPDAIRDLAKRAGVDIPESQEEDPHAKLRQKVKRLQKAYVDALLTSKEGQAYLKERGLTMQQASRYGIGYAPRGYKIDGLTPTEAIEIGMARKRDNGQVSWLFRHRLTFPVRDRQGRLIGFGGRACADDIKPKYLNTADSPLYEKSSALYHQRPEGMRSRKRTLVVEGYMDVIAVVEAGIPCSAGCGTALSATQAEMLIHSFEEIIFVFDADAAGLRATRRALDVFLPLIRPKTRLKIMQLEAGEDPDSWVRKHGKEAFSQRVDAARDALDFVFEELPEDAFGRTQALSELRDTHKKLPRDSAIAGTLGKRLRDEGLAVQMAAPKPEPVAVNELDFYSLDMAQRWAVILLNRPELVDMARYTFRLMDEPGRTIFRALNASENASPASVMSLLSDGWQERLRPFMTLRLPELTQDDVDKAYYEGGWERAKREAVIDPSSDWPAIADRLRQRLEAFDEHDRLNIDET